MRAIIPALLAVITLSSDPSLAAGDAALGEKVFNKCKACHTVSEGKHKVGPSLFKVVGKQAGTAAGFKRYRGLKGAEWAWTEQNLDQYLADPKKFVKQKANKSSAMVLKLKKQQDRDDVIAYLKSIK
ncbi:MAG: c-type cytochrome [Proteobacteria bacterium]|nr:c-type cytochrome [Pseudomonadota bacterium]